MILRFQRHTAAAAAFLFLQSLQGAVAQTVVVSATREPMAVERLAADVAVIDSDTLRNTTADSLADVVRREAGVQLSRSGGPGQSTGMLMRGSASRQSVVLVDGVRVGSATLGYAALEGLGMAPVERIEVLRGPGSSLYGADAVGGVVNIITRSGAPGRQLDVRLAVGGYGSREGGAGVRGAFEGWDYAATLSAERSDGVSAVRPGDLFGNYNPDRDGTALDAAQLRVGFKPAPGQRLGLTLLRTSLNTQYDSAEYDANFQADPSPDFRTHLDTTVAALDWRGTLSAGLNASARVSRSEDKSRSGGNQISRFRTTREQVSAQLAWQTGIVGQLVAALESNDDRATSTSYLAGARRRNHALALELTGHSGPFSWQGDLRRDDSSDFGKVSTGRLGGSYTLMPGLRLRALAGNTFSAPSFNDLHYPGYGVETLKPERGQSLEVGLNWRTASSEAGITLWRNRVRDLIGYQSDSTQCPDDPSYRFGCAANINRARLQGSTFSAAHRIGTVSLRAQLDLLQARDVATGQRLARRAAHQGSAAVDWVLGAWTLGADVLRIGARPDGGKTLAAETTLNLATTWRVAPAWTLQAKLINATDRDLEPARDYQGLGRQAWLVLRWDSL